MFLRRNPGTPSYQMEARSCCTLGWAQNWKMDYRHVTVPTYLPQSMKISQAKPKEKITQQVFSIETYLELLKYLLVFDQCNDN